LQLNPIAGDDIRLDYYLATPSTAPISAAADEFIRIAKGYLHEIRPKIRGVKAVKLR
jgi:hypothetical protein